MSRIEFAPEELGDDTTSNTLEYEFDTAGVDTSKWTPADFEFNVKSMDDVFRFGFKSLDDFNAKKFRAQQLDKYLSSMPRKEAEEYVGKVTDEEYNRYAHPKKPGVSARPFGTMMTDAEFEAMRAKYGK